MNFIDIATLIAFVAFNTDISLEAWKIYKLRSARDISIPGTTIRVLASAVLVAKFIYVEDPYLIIGQIIFSSILLAYLLLAIKYRNK